MAPLQHADRVPPSPYKANFTPYVLFSCLVAASGCFVYGYDMAIAGGISIMNDFLEKFYPNVLIEKQHAKQDNYCKYNNQVFQLFSSSLYLAALCGTFLASHVTRQLGRKVSMLVAGLLFDVGTIMGAGAQNLPMLVAGRVLLGFGVGFANQCIPLYIAEITPPKLRGRLGLLTGVFIQIGVVTGTIVNSLTVNIHPWGWRLSLGIAGVPAFTLTMAGLFLMDSPLSLIERGYMEQAKAVLCKIRGTVEVEDELHDLRESCIVARENKTPFRTVLKRSNRPQLVLAVAFPFFQQVAGNDAVVFYGTFLFKAAGFQDNAALYSSVITGAIGLLTASVGICIVDWTGRKKILFLGCVLMFPALVTMGMVQKYGLASNNGSLSRSDSVLDILMLCVFVGAFNFSWGPLPWLMPSELFAPEVRSVGQSVTVFVNAVFKFLIAQEFLSILCVMKWGVNLFFAGWVVVMFVFTWALIPETKGVPIGGMGPVWRAHWFWERFADAGGMDDAGDQYDKTPTRGVFSHVPLDP